MRNDATGNHEVNNLNKADEFWVYEKKKKRIKKIF